jgi:hypothetical protein
MEDLRLLAIPFKSVIYALPLIEVLLWPAGIWLAGAAPILLSIWCLGRLRYDHRNSGTRESARLTDRPDCKLASEFQADLGSVTELHDAQVDRRGGEMDEAYPAPVCLVARVRQSCRQARSGGAGPFRPVGHRQAERVRGDGARSAGDDGLVHAARSHLHPGQAD